jgi:undecaprenyl-diphosphatase
LTKLNIVVDWFRGLEHRMFYWVNRSISHSVLDQILNKVTHLGGATFTVAFTLIMALVAPGSWKTVGLQSLIALVISHLPVALIKRSFPRRRPYLSLPLANVCAKPLEDPSFPSGHTTAIFSVIVPFIVAMPMLSFILIPLGVIVGMSRVYLGLHYPSDCAAGCTIGIVSAVLTIAVF